MKRFAIFVLALFATACFDDEKPAQTTKGKQGSTVENGFSDPTLGLYVAPWAGPSGLTFNEITLLPNGKAYNNVPRSGAILAFDCDTDIPADATWDACGDVAIDGDTVTIAWPKRTEDLTRTAAGMEHGSYIYEKIRSPEGVVLDGTYQITTTVKSTILDRESTLTAGRSIAFDAAGGRFHADHFASFYSANNGTNPEHESPDVSAAYGDGDSDGTFELDAASATIHLVFDNGTETTERFFVLGDPAKPSFIYVGKLGYFVTPD